MNSKADDMDLVMEKDRKKNEHSSAMLCANAIKKELKTKFPNIKFSVKSQNFAGGNSVTIRYTDGTAKPEVEDVTRKYQYGHFDGSIDLYEYSNTRKDIPQAKYVMVERDFSPEAKQKLMKVLAKEYNIAEQIDLSKSFELFQRWINYEQLIWKEYQDKAVI